MTARARGAANALVLGWAVLAVAHGPGRAAAEAPRRAEPPVLQSDPRLQAGLTTDLPSPRVQDVLDRLREATGLHLAVQGGVDGGESAFGSLSLRNVPAWMVMEQLARSRAVEGYWEEVPGGYQLVGTRGGPPPPRKGVTLWLVVVSALVLLVVSGRLVMRRRAGETTPAGATRK